MALDARYSALLTDQYELVMACGYWKLGKSEEKSVFNLFFRQNPFGGNYTLCAGLSEVIEYLERWGFSISDLDYLAGLYAPDQRTRLFPEDFLDYLSRLRFTGDLDAIPEGTIVFPNEPLLRITAPLAQCQLLEAALINALNFSTLIATKATRICQAAYPGKVIEFGLRRAHGSHAGLLASRASYIGGCEGTSNVLAGAAYGIPIKGTQAHSWIMAFPTEEEAFEQFAETMPSNVILLVDTYNTISGIHHAIAIGKSLQEKGYRLLAIRLDSGDLLELSHTARALLDEANLTDTQILASGDLDEYQIAALKTAGAPIDLWGVGTKLVTAYDQPALSMVYKLSAIQTAQGWAYKMKVSDTPSKTSIPGIQQVRRYHDATHWERDVIYDIELGIESAREGSYTDLLTPIYRSGECVYSSPSLSEIRALARNQLNFFLQSSAQGYSVSLEPRLSNRSAPSAALRAPSPTMGRPGD